MDLIELLIITLNSHTNVQVHTVLAIVNGGSLEMNYELIHMLVIGC